jgi:hypothetical protein
MSVSTTLVPVGLGYVIAQQSNAIGGGLAFTGVVLGPSAGHWYAGRPGRGLATAALRLGTGLLAAAGALAAS